MRLLPWGCAAILVMALSNSAKAQVIPNNTLGTPVTSITNQTGQFGPVTVGGVMQNPNLQSANTSPNLLTSFWNWLGLGSSTTSASVTNGPVIIGQSVIPPPQYPTTFAPVMPITNPVPIYTIPSQR
jgi:hypothetical protein